MEEDSLLVNSGGGGVRYALDGNRGDVIYVPRARCGTGDEAFVNSDGCCLHSSRKFVLSPGADWQLIAYLTRRVQLVFCL